LPTRHVTYPAYAIVATTQSAIALNVYFRILLRALRPDLAVRAIRRSP